MKKCSVIIGSLRKNSNSLAVGKTIEKFLRETGEFEVSFPDIGSLPLFSEDLEQSPPESWVKFRAEIASSDCLLFITPEYNRGYPACIKNALDIGSRPNGKSVWSGKPGAVAGVSPGKIGASLAVNQLKQVLSFLNIPLLLQPECYIQADGSFSDGNIADGGTKDFIKLFAAKFVEFVNR
ncbi:MAG: NAD(P)H-dependent oxidoreductase [Ruminococcus sp.]|jgi:chromate reductase|nr:NAD(P)H-dependent oxidoreductase [Ruminococcus sp.]